MDQAKKKISVYKPRKCNPREDSWCRAVVNGASQTAAYRAVWQIPTQTDQIIAQRACLVAKRPHVVARLAQLRAEASKIVYVSVGERLSELGKIIKNRKAKDADRIRANEAYTRTAGDAAPDRIQLSTPEGQPLEIAGTVTTVSMTLRQKVLALKATLAAK